MGSKSSWTDKLIGVGNVVLPAAAGGVGFLVGGPAGAAVGAGLGLGAMQGINNYRNTQAEKENLAYQKNLQQQMFQREDTAVQRREADLLRAGLSPTLAAGSAASSGPIVNTKAPEIKGLDPAMLNIVTQAMGLLKMKADITQTESSKNLIDQQADKTKAEAALRWHDAGYYNNKDIPTNSTNISKDLSTLIGLFTDESPKQIIKDIGNKVQDVKKEVDNKILNVDHKTVDRLMNMTPGDRAKNPYLNGSRKKTK